jgi:hypothetical protein
MSYIEADYVPGNPTGLIVISKKTGKGTVVGVPVQIKTNDFLGLDVNGTSIPTNDNDKIFSEEQRILRVLDMMKDGNISSKKFGNSTISNSVFSIMGGPTYVRTETYLTIHAQSQNKLHEIENKFTGNLDDNVTKYSWTKMSKASPLDPKLPQKVVFKESGLGPDYFIDDPQYCGNIANEVIDPLERSGGNPYYFPENGQELVLTERFMTFFGFNGCELRAKRLPSGVYAYTINIPGLSPINAPSTKVGNFTVQWFQGNAEKNNFIKNGKNGQNPSTAIKRGLLFTKEMGDVLQVLIMFLWTKLNPGRPYTMVTCDKVVLLQCMTLYENCILTEAEGGQGVKLRNIYEYVGVNDPMQRAIDMFENEKRKIFEANNLFIQLFGLLRKNPQSLIYMAGSEASAFPSGFYDTILKDLTSINAMLQNLTPPDQRNPETVKASIEVMKTNFTFNLFIRDVSKTKIPKFQMMLAKKYTKTEEMWKGQIRPGFQRYGSEPFYLLGKNYRPSAAMAAGGGSIVGGSIMGGSQNLIMYGGAIEDDLDQIVGLRELLQFYEGTAPFYDPDPDNVIPNDPEDPNTLYHVDPVNLYEPLAHDIHAVLSSKGLEMYYMEFINEIFFNYYLLNAVLYSDTGLVQLIDDIIANDIVIPVPSQQLGSDINPMRTIEPQAEYQPTVDMTVPSQQLGSDINPTGTIEPHVEYQPTVETSNNFVRVAPNRQIEPAFKRGRNLSDELSGESDENQQNLSAKKRAISVGGKRRTLKRRRKQKKTKGRKQNKKSKKGKRSPKKTRKSRK